MSSTARRPALAPLAILAAALVATLAVAGCTARPPFGAPDAPLALHPVPDDRFVMPDGTSLPVRSWLPAGSAPAIVVLALHGFNDSRDAWVIPAPVFAQNGIAVFAPDQRDFGDTPGRGGWPGVDALVSDADAMARTLRQRYPAAKLFVMGESMGGAVAMTLATRPGRTPTDGTVMLAPAVWGRAELGAVLSSGLWLANGVAPGYRITGAEVPITVRASDNRDALLALARDPLTIRTTLVSTLAGLVDLMDQAQAAAANLHSPALVAYGAHDTLVPADAMAVAWAKLPGGVRRALYPNGYHLMLRDKDRQAPIGDVIAWMQDPAGFLPSGADAAAAAWAASHHPGGGITF